MADRILAACALVLAGVYLYATSQLPTLEIGDPLGPRAFPALLGVLFALAALLLFWEARRRPRRPGEAEPFRPSWRPRAVLAIGAATALLFALLEPLGYLVAITVYLAAVMRWLHGRATLLCFGVAALFAVGSYALFAKALGVTLAKGVLSF